MPWPAGKHRPAPARAKLTPEQVIEIRIRYADGQESMRQIAEAYGMGHDAIFKIINGYSWQHLPGTWDPALRNYHNTKEGSKP